MKDAQALAELDRTLQLIEANNMSAAETNRLVMQMITKSQAQGASWSGGLVLNIGILVGLILVIALLGGKSTCGGEGQPECTAIPCNYGYHLQCGGYYDLNGFYRFSTGCEYQWSCF